MTTELKSPKPSANSETRLQCEVLTRFDGKDSLAQDWDAAVVRLGGPIYMTYHWLKTWWDFYGAGCQLRVFVFRHEGRIAGLIPIYFDTIGIAPFGLRVARIVGSALPPKIFDPPMEPELAVDMWRQLIHRLFGSDHCDLLTFGPVAESHASVESIARASELESAMVQSPDVQTKDVQTIYNLPASYDEYFAALDSKERKTRRKKLRELEAVAAVRSDVVADGALVHAEFDMFVEQHTCQWQSEGRPGHFHAWPNALEYNRALVKNLAALGRVRFYRLFSGDQVITRQYGFVLGERLYAELPARAFGDPWDRFSLGCTSQIKLIESAIQEGLKRMDSGLGHYEYKILTGGTETKVASIRLQSSGAWSKLRTRVWTKIHIVLRLFLHKIWYRKVMPYLPAVFRSGQSKLLVRLDF